MTGSRKKSVLIIGGGAVGAIAALNLEVGGLTSVTLVLRSNFNAVNEHGFDIKSCDHGRVNSWKPSIVRNSIPDIAKESLPPYDYIVLCTKNIPGIPPTVVDLVTPALPKANSHTTLVLLQNGLHIYTPFLETHPQTLVLSGISMIGSEEISPGQIIQNEGDRLIIGAFPNPNIDSPTSAALEFVSIYQNGGKTDCKLGEDVLHDRWRKLVYNACLNPICAILSLDTGRLRLAADGEVIEKLVRPAMQEIVDAARANGVVLDEDVVQKMIDVDPLQSYLSPSMLADVKKGNLIEYENLLGGPLREGRKAGVKMPTIEMLYYMAKGIQWRTMEARGMVDIPPQNV
ncbi:hypothetical protein PMIN04_003158 [Paraphaeosphaeria minitans]